MKTLSDILIHFSDFPNTIIFLDDKSYETIVYFHIYEDGELRRDYLDHCMAFISDRPIPWWRYDAHDKSLKLWIEG